MATKKQVRRMVGVSVTALLASDITETLDDGVLYEYYALNDCQFEIVADGETFFVTVSKPRNPKTCDCGPSPKKPPLSRGRAA